MTASLVNNPVVFNISPLIRITLLTMYIALTIPLPFLAKFVSASIPPSFLWLGIIIGFVGLYGIMTERVIADEVKIEVTYTNWIRAFLRRGWSLYWSEITQLKSRTTGQGGIVYYFITSQGEAYLLPMRIAGFARLVNLVQAKTGIDTSNVYPLAQPWMYMILLGLTFVLLLVDSWTITNALTLSNGLQGF
ncbi:hypothetical protein [Richelia intracellularis]|uniref:hypothetical protein n=1 Tax=Richelia intracellularis TaxID=1164990 RepID=UPI0005C5FD26|nr:hypothetical protein [Richelia intracellularis]